MPTSILPRLRAFARDNSAVAAVEMALVAPAAIALFALIVASQQSLTAWRKTVTAAHEITDLVARTPTTTPDASIPSAVDLSLNDLDANLGLAPLVMYPESPPGFQMVVSEVQMVKGSNKASVVWSRGYNGAKCLATGTQVTLDPTYATVGMNYFLIGTATYNFQPLSVTLNVPPLTLTSTETMSIRNAQQIVVPGIPSC